MRRRAKPAKGSIKGKRPATRKSPKTDDARVQDLEKRLAEAVKREAEAREQQAATSEILRVISGSPTDEQPVFDAIVRSARRLCDASFSVVILTRGGQQILAAVDGLDPAETAAVLAAYPSPVDRDRHVRAVGRQEVARHLRLDRGDARSRAPEARGAGARGGKDTRVHDG